MLALGMASFRTVSTAGVDNSTALAMVAPFAPETSFALPKFEGTAEKLSGAADGFSDAQAGDVLGMGEPIASPGCSDVGDCVASLSSAPFSGTGAGPGAGAGG
eukprot:6195746-Pleurochrysis_carterae.AAC.4